MLRVRVGEVCPAEQAGRLFLQLTPEKKLKSIRRVIFCTSHHFHHHHHHHHHHIPSINCNLHPRTYFPYLPLLNWTFLLYLSTNRAKKEKGEKGGRIKGVPLSPAAFRIHDYSLWLPEFQSSALFPKFKIMSGCLSNASKGLLHLVK